MRGLREVSIFLGVLVLSAGCASTSAVGGAAPRWISEHGGVCELSDQSARLDTIAIQYSALLRRPIAVHVLENDVLAAWAWPSGDIYVTRGLVSRMSDAELAAVIGHELGHLLDGGHFQTTMAVFGRSPADQDIEAAADARSIQILSQLGIPTSAMRTALVKVRDSQPPAAGCRAQLEHRIALLP
jgi:Zn-dependent protease with chaperone function